MSVKIYKFLKYLIFFYCFGIGAGINTKSEIVANKTIAAWRKSLRSLSNVSIDVRLKNLSILASNRGNAKIEISNQTGLIEILVPHTPDNLFLCFPQSSEDYQQIYLFAHATCRQLGFMTFADIKGKEIPNFQNGRHYFGIEPNSYRCLGHEQSLLHCRWNDVTIDACQMLTEVSCGACYDTVKAFNGIIKSPGYPLAVLPDLTCEWNIIVPQHHSIVMSFDHFEVRDKQLPCGVHNPYIEIMFGLQSEVTVYRYCRSDEVKNLSIPFNTVKIRTFTGIHTHHDNITNEKTKGLVVTFKAVPMEEEYDSPLKMILFFLLGIIFLVCTIFCHYIQKHKLCNYYLENTRVPEEEDMKRTRKFERCLSTNTRVKYSPLPTYHIKKEIVDRFSYSSTSGPSHESGKVIRKSPSITETPKRLISTVNLNNINGSATEKSVSWGNKVNLLERYTEKENPNRLSVTSPVFFPAVSRYDIHRSTSSEDVKDNKKK